MRSPNSNLHAYGTETFTGKKLGIHSGFLRKISGISFVHMTGTAADANDCLKITITIDENGKTFNLFAWKATAANDNTLIPATDSITVTWLAIGE